MINTLSGSRCRGLPTSGEKQTRHKVTYYTVEYDARKPKIYTENVSKFSAGYVNNREWGMLNYGNFAEGTILRKDGGKRYRVEGRKLVEIVNE